MRKILLATALITGLLTGAAYAQCCCKSGFYYGGNYFYPQADHVYVDPAPYYNGGPYTGNIPTVGLHRCVKIEGKFNFYGFWVPSHTDCWDE
jgi:hypothetical protein